MWINLISHTNVGYVEVHSMKHVYGCKKGVLCEALVYIIYIRGNILSFSSAYKFDIN